MGRPSRMLSKLSQQNQLTLPKAAVAALDWPTHFRVQVSNGALVLWPVALVAPGDAAAALGVDAEALREARRATRERRGDAAVTSQRSGNDGENKGI